MNRFDRVLCRNLIFSALFELIRTVSAKDFPVLYAMNEYFTDDSNLISAGTMGILRKQKNSASEFDLIKNDAIEYTFDSNFTTIVHMYGDIMILSQYLPGAESDDCILHCKFKTDGTCREFQQELNPTSLQNSEIEAQLVQLRLIDETYRTPDRALSIQSATVLSTFVDSHEMKVFKIIEGSPGQNIRPQRTHLIFPENGFHVTEPYGKEVMLYPSAGESWKYILRFANREEAIVFARIMSSYSEDRILVQLDFDIDWFSIGYFKP